MAHAEVAVRYPHVPGPDLGQDVVQQRPLLGMAVLTRDQVRDQHQCRLQHRQRLARQGRGRLVACLPEAMFRGGEVVAVQDAHAVARHGLGQQAAEVAEYRLQPLRGVAHQFRGDLTFDAAQLVVHGGEGHGDVDHAGLVGGTDAGLHVRDHQAHQVHHGREEQVAGVLRLGVLLE